MKEARAARALMEVGGSVPMGIWSVETLGVPQLVSPEGRRVRLERRGAALLAYLALCGRVAKYPLSCLLWPDAPPATVRSNMRQLLRRLRTATGTEAACALVQGDAEWLQLHPQASVDVAALRAAAAAGAHAQVLQAPSAELLEGLDFDDCPDFARWLDGARLTLESWRVRAREGELARLEREGDSEGALALVHAWVRAEPESEAAARAQMRLHFLRGERSVALAAFERIRAVLAQELDVRPMPETLALARELERGARLPEPPPPRAPLPLSLLRPPVLAGREEAWEQLREGCARGQLLFLSGAPGIGKSRLAEEFAESRGRWFRVQARPGDRDVPYASQARALRSLLAHSPGLQLPQWVRHALGRLLPELGEPGAPQPPLPLESEGEKLRLYDAMAELSRRAMGPYALTLAEDLQHWDAASAEAFLYALSRGLGAVVRQARPRLLGCFREGELPASSRAALQQLVAAGQARVVHLGPLPPAHVRELLAGLGLNGVVEHAEELARHSGGNPLFLVETVRRLLETGALQGPWPERLPSSRKVTALLQQRMEQLSPRAQLLAEVAAVAGERFSLALAARVLHQEPAELTAPARELDEAQRRLGALRVREAVEAGLAPATRELLQRLVEAELGVDARCWPAAALPSRL